LLIRSLSALLGTNKTVVAHELYPNEYNKHYYFNEKMCNGIKFIADYEHCKKRAAEILMQAGFSPYMGEKLTEYIEADRIAREHNKKMKIPRFVMLLRRYARKKAWISQGIFCMTATWWKAYFFYVLPSFLVMIVYKKMFCDPGFFGEKNSISSLLRRSDDREGGSETIFRYL
jgi:hypothetical protein